MIEVGAIHATGLQCLLSNPAMARGTCTPMLYGGLRCYEGTPPDVIVPSDYSGVPNPAGVERSGLTNSFGINMFDLFLIMVRDTISSLMQSSIVAGFYG